MDDIVLRKGGTVESHLREAFLKWDGTSSGELSVDEFRGAMTKQIGLSISKETATQVVRYYDRNGHVGKYDDDEIHYKDLIKEICDDVPHFSSHPDTARIQAIQTKSTNVHIPTPRDISSIFSVLRDAIITRKNMDVATAKDFFLGLCVRVDDGLDSGRLTKLQLAKILKELNVPLRDHAIEDLVCWYDSDGSRRIPYKPLADDLFRRPPPPQIKSRSLPSLSAFKPTPDVDTARVKMARIAAERESIKRRLKELNALQAITESS